MVLEAEGGGAVKCFQVTGLSNDTITINVGSGGNPGYGNSTNNTYFNGNNGLQSNISFTNYSSNNSLAYGGGGGGSGNHNVNTWIIGNDSSANSGGSGSIKFTNTLTQISGNCGNGYFHGGFGMKYGGGGGGGCAGGGYGSGGYSGNNFHINSYTPGANVTTYSFDNSANTLLSNDGGPGIQLTISGSVMNGINPNWYFGAGGGGGGGYQAPGIATGNGGKGGGGCRWLSWYWYNGYMLLYNYWKYSIIK
jgi:hypothetical protein